MKHRNKIVCICIIPGLKSSIGKEHTTLLCGTEEGSDELARISQQCGKARSMCVVLTRTLELATGLGQEFHGRTLLFYTVIVRKHCILGAYRIHILCLTSLSNVFSRSLIQSFDEIKPPRVSVVHHNILKPK